MSQGGKRRRFSQSRLIETANLLGEIMKNTNGMKMNLLGLRSQKMELGKVLCLVSILLGTSLLSSEPVVAADVKVVGSQAAGTGCPDQNVGIIPSADKTLYVFYRELDPKLTNDRPFARENCIVQVSYQHNGGRQFAVKRVSLHMTKSLDDKTATVAASMRVVDPSVQADAMAEVEKDVSGSGSDNMLLDLSKQLQWGPCQDNDTMLRFSAEARITGKDGNGESVKLRYAIVTLTSRPC
jgi:hypothetical protein